MSTKIGFYVEQLPYCCGFDEVGGMCYTNDDEYYSADEEELVEDVIPRALSCSGGRPIIFNFVRRRTKEKSWDASSDWYKDVPLKKRYEVAPLRQIVKHYPGVKHIGTWINPGTGNQIDSYVILKEAK